MKNKAQNVNNISKSSGDVNEKNFDEKKFVLSKKNYVLLLIGFLFIIIGFVLMTGGGTDDPTVFSYEIFSFRRITLAPIFILLGFAIEIFAIMWIPKKNDNK